MVPEHQPGKYGIVQNGSLTSYLLYIALGGRPPDLRSDARLWQKSAPSNHQGAIILFSPKAEGGLHDPCIMGNRACPRHRPAWLSPIIGHYHPMNWGLELNTIYFVLYHRPLIWCQCACYGLFGNRKYCESKVLHMGLVMIEPSIYAQFFFFNFMR